MNDTTQLTGKKAPAFKAPVIGGKYQEGDTVSLADLKGQTVVLYFNRRTTPLVAPLKPAHYATGGAASGRRLPSSA